MLRIRRPARSCHARAGRVWVLLPLACALVAAQASANAAYARGSAEPDRPRTEAAAATAPAGGEDEGTTARLAQVDQEIAEIDRLLATAHFHTALAVAGATRDLLDRSGGDPQLGARRARLEVMAATAEVALGQRTPARRSMVRALRAAPDSPWIRHAPVSVGALSSGLAGLGVVRRRRWPATGNTDSHDRRADDPSDAPRRLRPMPPTDVQGRQNLDGGQARRRRTAELITTPPIRNMAAPAGSGIIASEMGPRLWGPTWP